MPASIARRGSLARAVGALMLLAATAAPPAAAAGLVVDRVVATVNGEAITLLDLYKAELPQFGTVLVSGGPDLKSAADRARELQLLEKLVEERLLVKHAEERGFRASPEEIDEAVERVKRDGKMTEEMLQSALAQRRMTLAAYRQKLANEIVVSKLYSAEVMNKVVVTGEEVAVYYGEHQDEFSLPERVMIRHIIIRHGSLPAEDDDARARAENARSLIAGGQDFREVAQIYSQDPPPARGEVSGYLRRGDMISELEEVVFNLQPGELSPVVATPVGYHVVLSVVRESPRTSSLEEVGETIRKRLLQEKTAKRAKDFVGEVKRQAAVEIRL